MTSERRRREEAGIYRGSGFLASNLQGGDLCYQLVVEVPQLRIRNQTQRALTYLNTAQPVHLLAV